MEDMKIICSDCGETFIFSARDQKFYEDNGYVSPKRCHNCRVKRKQKMKGENNYGK